MTWYFDQFVNGSNVLDYRIAEASSEPVLTAQGKFDGKMVTAKDAGKVVYHLSDLEKVAFVLGNIENHLAGVGGPEKVTIALVVHGPALRAFHSAGANPDTARKLASVVKNFSEAMDNVRGEHTHAWLQVDERQFWLVHFSNMFALGRIKTVKSCHVWTSAIETILRWAGLANDWYVEEVECGSVSGTFDCAFAIRASETS